MKYFEYIYLLIAIFIGLVLVKQYSLQPMWQNYILIAGIGIASFMFSFRRTQRKRRQDNQNP